MATDARRWSGTRPDVLLINEFDFEYGGVALAGFQDNYLSVGHGSARPIDSPFRYTAPSNTGIPSDSAIRQLLDSPKVNTKVTPSSEGAVEQSLLQGGANTLDLSDPRFDTADFFDGFGPPPFGLVGTFPFPSSDHRLVWVDVRVS